MTVWIENVGYVTTVPISIDAFGISILKKNYNHIRFMYNGTKHNITLYYTILLVVLYRRQ